MRKIYLSGLVALAIGAMFTSCSKDNDLYTGEALFDLVPGIGQLQAVYGVSEIARRIVAALINAASDELNVTTTGGDIICEDIFLSRNSFIFCSYSTFSCAAC